VGENVLNHQYFHRGLLDFGQIWYRVDHVTSDLLQKFKVKGQGHSVKTSFDRQITGPFGEIGVAIGNVGSAEKEFVRMRSTKLAKNSREQLAPLRAVFTLQCIRNCCVF